MRHIYQLPDAPSKSVQPIMLRQMLLLLSLLIIVGTTISGCRKDGSPSAPVDLPELLRIKKLEQKGTQLVSMDIELLIDNPGVFSEIGICWTAADRLPENSDNVINTRAASQQIVIDSTGLGDVLTFRLFWRKETQVRYSQQMQVAMPPNSSRAIIRELETPFSTIHQVLRPDPAHLVIAATRRVGTRMQTALLKTDTALRLVWEARFPLQEKIENVILEQMPDGFLISERTSQWKKESVTIGKADFDGNVIWYRNIMEVDQCRLLALSASSRDSGRVIAAQRSSYDDGFERSSSASIIDATFGQFSGAQAVVPLTDTARANWPSVGAVTSNGKLLLVERDIRTGMLSIRHYNASEEWSASIGPFRRTVLPTKILPSANNRWSMLSVHASDGNTPVGYVLHFFIPGHGWESLEHYQFMSPHAKRDCRLIPTGFNIAKNGDLLVCAQFDDLKKPIPYLARHDSQGKLIWNRLLPQVTGNIHAVLAVGEDQHIAIAETEGKIQLARLSQ